MPNIISRLEKLDLPWYKYVPNIPNDTSDMIDRVTTDNTVMERNVEREATELIAADALIAMVWIW